MGGLENLNRHVSSQSQQVAAVAAVTAINIGRDETYEALPGLHLVNQGVEWLKESIHNGERGCSCKKACAYLAFRIVSYSCIPLALNLLSLVLSAVMTLLTLPLRCCNESINRWCLVRLQASAGYTLQSLFDLTCDLRQLSGLCCCPPNSIYRAI